MGTLLRTLRGVLLALAMAGTAPALAAEAQLLAQDPVVEQRVQDLSEVLRCLVCQNQTIADSNAPLAEDLRREIREMIAQGKTDKEITDFMVARYGDFVLYRPPVKAATAPLWIGPFVLLAIGVFVLIRVLKKRAATADLEGVDEDLDQPGKEVS